MTPDALEARLAGRPDTATVAAVLAALHADPAWTVTELTLAGWPTVMELVHRPTGTAFTLRRRRGDQLVRWTEGR